MRVLRTNYGAPVKRYNLDAVSVGDLDSNGKADIAIADGSYGLLIL